MKFEQKKKKSNSPNQIISWEGRQSNGPRTTWSPERAASKSKAADRGPIRRPQSRTLLLGCLSRDPSPSSPSSPPTTCGTYLYWWAPYVSLAPSPRLYFFFPGQSKAKRPCPVHSLLSASLILFFLFFFHRHLSLPKEEGAPASSSLVPSPATPAPVPASSTPHSLPPRRGAPYGVQLAVVLGPCRLCSAVTGVDWRSIRTWTCFFSFHGKGSLDALSPLSLLQARSFVYSLPAIRCESCFLG